MSGYDEVNKYLHEEIMEKCWHKWGSPVAGHRGMTYTCEKCNERLYSRFINPNPKYTHNLDDVSMVELKVVAKIGPHYAAWLETYIAADREINGWPETIAFITAPAHDRARACMSAWKEYLKEKQNDKSR